MPEPIVTKVVDAAGVERWGSVDAPWVVKGLADGSVTDPNQPPAVQTAEPAKATDSEEAGDAPTVPADGDDPKPRPARR